MDYARLKEVIDLNVRPNGRQAITGYVLNAVLNAVLEELGAGWQFAGVAKPGEIEVPAGGEDAKLFWLMAEYGIYTFDGGKNRTGVGRREARLMTYDGGAWRVENLGLPNLEAVDALKADLDAEAERAKGAESGLGEDIAAARQEAADGIGAINSKIPAQASAANKLADKDFVNSSISTATATFRGTFASLDELKAAEADKNDYAFYVHKDAAGNTVYDKYTYDGAEWRYEYALNNSSFTAAQWAAINSGATAEEIAQISETADEVANVKANLRTEAGARAEKDAELERGVEDAKAIATAAQADASAAKTAAGTAASDAAEAKTDVASLGEQVTELTATMSALKADGYTLEDVLTYPTTVRVPEGKDNCRLFWLLTQPGDYRYNVRETSASGVVVQDRVVLLRYDGRRVRSDGSTSPVWSQAKALNIPLYTQLAEALAPQFAGYVAPGGTLTPPNPRGWWYWLLDTAKIDGSGVEDAAYNYTSGGEAKVLTLNGYESGIALFSYKNYVWDEAPTYLPSVVGIANYQQLYNAQVALSESIDGKQDALVSGTNIKTVNGSSLLGSGNLVVSGGLASIEAGEGEASEVFNGCPPSSAPGFGSHVEGDSAVSAARTGDYSHAEGGGQATGDYSHAEGYGTITSSHFSHAEGYQNQLTYTSRGGHVEGYGNDFSAAHGLTEGFHGGGRFAYSFASTLTIKEVLRVIGCGTSTTDRKDALVICGDGSLYLLDVGGYYGKSVEEGHKSLQEVIADLTARVEALEAK